MLLTSFRLTSKFNPFPTLSETPLRNAAQTEIVPTYRPRKPSETPLRNCIFAKIFLYELNRLVFTLESGIQKQLDLLPRHCKYCSRPKL